MPTMDYSLVQRTPDGTGKILVTTPGSPGKGSWETEAELKTYVNQDTVMKTDIVQSLGQQTDKVPSNKAVDDAISALGDRVDAIEETLMGENEITVQYPDDGNYRSLMPNKVPARALKFAEVPRFRGKSRAWNQLIDPSYATSDTRNNVTFTNNSNGSWTVTTNGGTASDTSYLVISPNLDTSHKYLMGIIGATNVRISQIGWYSASSFEILNFNASSPIAFMVDNGVSVNNETVWPVLYDLTLIFGAGNEPSTVADALAQLPALGQYNAYDAGSLVSTTVNGVESVGVNIWDEEWELGEFNTVTGATYPANDRIRTKNFIPITPNTAYYLSIPTITGQVQTCWYDKEKNFIGSDNPLIINSSVISPSNAYFVKFSISTVYGTTYNHDIQICLNSYPDKTIYHPYKSDSLALPEPVTLRSAESASDELAVESGVITRKVEAIDLGGDDGWGGPWSYSVSQNIFYRMFPAGSIRGLGSFSARILCSKYKYEEAPWTNHTDKTIGVQLGLDVSQLYDVVIKDTDYSDVATFKSAMSGVMLNYEIATPYTESIDPVPYNFLEVEGGGTVETIQTQSPVIDNCLDVTYDIIPQ